MAPTLEVALSHFLRLGPALRAIALDIGGTSDLTVSARASERAGHALAGLHALGVPIVCSVDSSVGGVGMAAWSAAHYRIAGERTNLQAAHSGSVSERAARPRERATHFAAGLAYHAAIGTALGS